MTFNRRTLKKILSSFLLVTAFSLSSCTTDDVLKTLESLPSMQGGNGGANAPLGQSEIVAGLKQALKVGATFASSSLNKQNAFFTNDLIKIAFPPEARKIQSTLKGIGLDNLNQKVILTLNRAAEDAAIKAKPIFVAAITSMTLTDAVGILKGDARAATDYLQKATSGQLTKAFRPVIASSLKKVDATKYWGDVVTQYNRIPLVKSVNTDLTGYVTQKALFGLFSEVAKEEKKIRDNPMARTTDLLKRVFGGAKAML